MNWAESSQELLSLNDGKIKTRRENQLATL